MPYWNSSVYNPIDKHKDGAKDTGSIFNPQKTSKEGSYYPMGEETQGNLGILNSCQQIISYIYMILTDSVIR